MVGEYLKRFIITLEIIRDALGYHKRRIRDSGARRLNQIYATKTSNGQFYF